MRCGCIITHKERRSQSGTRMAIDKRSVQSWWGTSDIGAFPSHPTMADYLAKPNTSICEGKIVATVAAEDEPYMGGTSAVFSITYKCDTCDNDFYPELPQTSEEVSAMLTGHIASLDSTPMREARRDQELRHRAEQEEWRRQAMADLKEREAERRRKKAVAASKPKG